MRLLHTSDWHLGRLFHGASLLDEQELALDRIVDLVEDRSVDVVIIAGDLYDRAVPPADAVELFDRTLHRLHLAGTAVVAISGNHDSAVRVGFGDRLLERMGVTVRGDLRRTGDPVVLSPTDGTAPVRIYPIPYLDPLATAHVARADADDADPLADDADTSGEDAPDGAGRRRRFTHHDAMAWAMQRVRADLAAGAAADRSVVVAHTFLTGGNPSASERDLTVGHVEQVRLDLFDGIDYVALGHLHQRQAFDGGRVAYSGSPLRYSFSEERNIASVRLVDLGADGSVEVEQVPVGVGRGLSTITGELEELLGRPDLAGAESCWVRAVLTDRRLPLQAMRRLQDRFPHAVELSHEPAGSGAVDVPGRTSRQVRTTDPVELATAFLTERRGALPDDEEQRILTDAFDTVAAERAS